jgi:hypothetical protein
MRVAIILTVAASASAANLRHYTGYNCGGGFAECVDVGSSVRFSSFSFLTILGTQY